MPYTVYRQSTVKVADLCASIIVTFQTALDNHGFEKDDASLAALAAR
jgi:hypothetical protein